MTNILKKIDFGNEAGDDVEYAELKTYFVSLPIFDEIFSLENKIKLVTAKKGIGKSALLKYLYFKLQEEEQNSLIIYCRGSELVRTQFAIKATPETPNEYIRDWMIRLAALANRKIASSIKIPLSENDLSIIESSEIEGFKEKNFLLALLDRFSGLADKYYPKAVGIKSEIEAFKRIKNKSIIFIIDDLDATFQNTSKELMELSTFFSAVRYLTQDIKAVSFRISLRGNVWTTIRKYDEALDKFEQYRLDLAWNYQEMHLLIDERILSELRKMVSDHLISKVIKNTPKNELQYCIMAQKMMWGDKSVDSFQVINTLSYNRPRWAIQLLKLAQKDALSKDSTAIQKANIDNVWEEYGNKRIADLVSEHKHQCLEILNLINAFRLSERKMERDILFGYINKHILSHFKPTVDGKIRNTPLDIAQFLYRIGFIIGRVEFDDEKQYRHLFFEEFPDLLITPASNDFNCKWEIHPCYREALSIKKLSKR